MMGNSFNKGRKVSETRKFFARKGDEVKGKPVVVLINNGSASASEIFERFERS